MRTPLLLLAALFAVSLSQAQTVVTESDVVRQAENTPPTNNWVLYTRTTGLATGTGTFRNGPGSPPLGTGSFETATPDGGDKVFLSNYDHIGTLLADIDGMGYATYRDGSSTGSAIQVPSINLVIDFNGSDAGGFATLVFEPYYSAAAQGAVASDTWQTWDAYDGGAAIWWSTRAMPGVCAFSCFVSWDTIVSNNPNAVVSGAFTINQGSGNANILAATDMLSISANGNSVTYNFEFAAPVNNTVVVTQNDLEDDFVTAYNGSAWFFYNDENDTIDNSLGSFVNGPGTPPAGSGSAAISVSGNQRRNLSTYQFGGTPLASITAMGFSTYNPSAGNGGAANRSAYINFDVDFNTTNPALSGYQGRLIFLPKQNGTVVQDTWQDWDALMGGAALWTWSGYGSAGNMWPDGNTTRYRTWSSLLAAFPGISIHDFFKHMAMRVGEPYANGYSENLDRFVFGTAAGTTTFDFEPGSTSTCSDPSQDPFYAGGYVLNSAGTRAFIEVSVPRGGTTFEFYNMTNLVVGAPETDPESGTTIAGVTRSGNTFTFSPASPATVFFPITTATSATGVRFFLRVTDDCTTVDVDPAFTLTAVAQEEMTGFALGAPQPNPAASQATIRFSLERASAVRLSVYDVLGREVARLVDGFASEGAQTARLDASAFSSGLYVVRLEADGRVLTQTITVAR